MMKNTLVLMVSFLAFSLTGCEKNMQKGIDAFYARDYKEAVRLLKPFYEKAKNKEPVFEVTIDEKTDVKKVVRPTTDQYFKVANAYAGSLLGLEKTDDACDVIQMAMRPVTLNVDRDGKTEVHTFDPREGYYWPGEAVSLRVWEEAIPCE